MERPTLHGKSFYANTDQALLVVLVVGDFDLLEGDLAGHPVFASGGRLRVDILEHLLTVGLSLPNVDPLGVDVLVPAVSGESKIDSVRQMSPTQHH